MKVTFKLVALLFVLFTACRGRKRSFYDNDEIDNEIRSDPFYDDDRDDYSDYMEMVEEIYKDGRQDYDNDDDVNYEKVNNWKEYEKNDRNEFKDSKEQHQKGSDAKTSRLTKKEILKKLKNIHSLDEFRRNFEIKEDEHNYKRQVVPQPIKMDLNDCGPKPSPYHLPTTNDVLYPNDVTCLARHVCGGSCCTKEKRVCVAKQTETIRAQFYRLDHSVGMFKPYTVSYENETLCECQCKLKQTDCVGAQLLNNSTCTCECSTSKSCDSNKQWSDHTCQCECSSKPNCPTNYEWDASVCTCKKVSNNPSCPTGKILDTAACGCN